MKLKSIINSMREKFELSNKGTRDFPIGIFDQTVYYPEKHHHIEYELFYLESGNITFGIDEEEVQLTAGDVIFIQPDVDHYVKKVPDNKYHYYAIVFDAEVLGPKGDKMRSVFESIRIYRYLSLSNEILIKLDQAAKSNKANDFGNDFLLKSVLYDVVSYVINTKQYVEIGQTLSGNNGKGLSCIDVVLSYIAEHYRENISLDDVMAVSSYSKSHFIRLFKRYVGVNVTNYINQYRVEKACLDLIYTNKNITEVATENGFNTVQYFSKIFKDYMNCSPKQYQKKGRNLTVPSTIASVTV